MHDAGRTNISLSEISIYMYIRLTYRYSVVIANQGATSNTMWVVYLRRKKRKINITGV